MATIQPRSISAYSSLIRETANLLLYLRMDQASGVPVDELGHITWSGPYSDTVTFRNRGPLINEINNFGIKYGTDNTKYGHYVSSATSAYLNPTAAISIEFWGKWTTTHAITALVRNDGWKIIRNASGYLQFILTTSGGVTKTITDTVVRNDGLWHHVIGTWDGSTQTFYVDGVSVGTPLSWSGTLKTNSGANWADLSAYGGAEYMDELALYDRALSTDEIAARLAHAVNRVNSPTLIVSLPSTLIRPSSIASVESVSTPQLVPGGVQVLPSSISSAETVNSPTLIARITLVITAISSGQAVNQPSLLPGGVSIRPNGISSSETVSNPSLVPGGVSIQLSSISSSESINAPTLLPGAVTVGSSSIDGSTAVTSPTITTQVAIVLQGISSGEAVGQATLVPVAAVLPTSIASAEAVGSHQLVISGFTSTELLANSIASLEAFGNPALVAGGVLLQLTAIDPDTTINGPILLPGGVLVSPEAIADMAGQGHPILVPRKRTWQWLNRASNWSRTQPPKDVQLQDVHAEVGEVGTVQLQDGFRRLRRRE